jgi:hypothetical protein
MQELLRVQDAPAVRVQLGALRAAASEPAEQRSRLAVSSRYLAGHKVGRERPLAGEIDGLPHCRICRRRGARWRRRRVACRLVAASARCAG